MQPSRRSCLCALVVLFAVSWLAPRTNANTLAIASSPAGATVEIDGIAVGITPCVIKYPGGYFHKTRSVFGAKLEHPLVLRISKDGYAAKEIQLTEGPFDWVSLEGKNRGRYYLLKTNKIAENLDPAPDAAAGKVKAKPIDAGKVEYRVEMPAAESSISANMPSDGGAVEIVSNPTGAEIYIDGKFVGQTPSRLHLPSGSHSVEVRAEGKQTWVRNLYILKDSQVTLQATLQ